MASSKGVVTLNGRYKRGSNVSLYKVRDERTLRAEGGELIDTQTVDDDGRLQFTKGVEVGARYILVGQIDGQHVEVRARGNTPDDDNGLLTQHPVTPDRVKLSDGTWADERPEREDPPFGGVGPAPGLHQVPEGTQLRSDTGRGYAHPVDPDEQAPYPPQSEYEGEEQRSATEHGQATPVAHGAALSQEDVKDGTWQRSDTPQGVATPIPEGDAVQAQEARESADTKAAVGDPGKAAAAPVDHAVAKSRKAKKAAAKSSTKNDKE